MKKRKKGRRRKIDQSGEKRGGNGKSRGIGLKETSILSKHCEVASVVSRPREISLVEISSR